MKLSVVSTLFRSEPYLAEFHRRVTAAARAHAGDSYEIVLVNDGSPDASLEVAVAIADSDPHVVVIDLSRNFGHHRAIMTGLAHAVGNQVFLIDSDLEESPEWLEEFSGALEKSGSDVAFGVQAQRRGTAIERWGGTLFYRSYRLITGLDIPESAVTARLMTRQYVDALVQHGDRELFYPALMHLTGFSQSPVRVDKLDTSECSYRIRDRWALFGAAIIPYSNRPLILVFFLGMLISLVAGVFLAGDLVSGWLAVAPSEPSGLLMSSIWLLGGLTIASIGTVGLYLSRVYAEVQRRPYTIVRRIYAQRTRTNPEPRPSHNPVDEWVGG